MFFSPVVCEIYGRAGTHYEGEDDYFAGLIVDRLKDEGIDAREKTVSSLSIKTSRFAFTSHC